MQEAGWVYLLMNPSMNGLIKIGKTTRDPDDRVQELSGVTGVPTPFVLVYKAYFTNCHNAESYIHTLLETQQYRLSNNREFFTAPIDVGINAIIRAKTYFTNSNERSDDLEEVDSNSSNADVCSDFFDAGDNYYYGLGDTIQDIGRAIKNYTNAYKLGSSKACVPLGKIYSTETGYINDAKSIEYFNEGIRRGAFECYAELALLYAERDHIDNAIKCWNKYFDSELPSECLIGKYESMYIKAVKLSKIDLRHKHILINRFDWIVNYTNDIINYLENQGIDASMQYADLDFASFLLKNTFISGKRHVGFVKILESGTYVIEDEKKNYWIFDPHAMNEILDGSNVSKGLFYEYNLVRFPNMNEMALVCNLVQVDTPLQLDNATVNLNSEQNSPIYTEQVHSMASPKRGWFSRLFS